MVAIIKLNVDKIRRERTKVYLLAAAQGKKSAFRTV